MTVQQLEHEASAQDDAPDIRDERKANVMSSATLTSLAMLKVNVDQGKDYLDYLRPFILQILVDQKPDPVRDWVIRNHLRTQFGLEIPERAVQVVLKRLSKSHPLRKEEGVYRITGILQNPGIIAEKSRADRHIQAVSSGLMEFSKSTAQPIVTLDEAETAICAFLARFNIPCLRAYLRGTTIPTIAGNHDVHIVLVSEYVLHLQQTDVQRFDSFLIMVQGHMLANALLCPDLQYAPKTYKGVTFYLDTPLLVRRLGLEGEPKKAAAKDLIGLLHNLGATVAAFAHSRDELGRVLRGAADHVDAPDGRGAIVMEARRRGTTKSDLLLLVGQVDDRLREAQIDVKDTPRYIADFQIDETAFEKVLEDEVSYFNPRARECDINSVRSIYVLRARTSPSTIEKSGAVLVTSNSGFAQAACEYGQRHEESREVSSVITDFSLANMAWLKAPMGASSLPMTEILAFSYAALQPSNELLNKYLTEIDKLEKHGKITARDHQLLRSSTLAQEELVRLTLGDEDALTEEAVTETLKRVSNEIKKEESQKLSAEQIAHRKAQEDLTSERAAKRQVQQRLYWRCSRRAKSYSWFVAVCVGVLLLGGITAGWGVKSAVPILGWILLVGSSFMTIVTTLDMMVGFSVRQMRERLEKRLLRWFIRREAAATGLDLADFR